MLYFSQRKRLGEMAEEWCEQNGVLKCAASYVSLLMSRGLINEDKARELLNKEKLDERQNL